MAEATALILDSTNPDIAREGCTRETLVSGCVMRELQRNLRVRGCVVSGRVTGRRGLERPRA